MVRKKVQDHREFLIDYFLAPRLIVYLGLHKNKVSISYLIFIDFARTRNPICDHFAPHIQDPKQARYLSIICLQLFNKISAVFGDSTGEM